MTDAPKRIWVPEGADLSILAIQNPDEPEHEYILASEVAALIHEAEARGMERAATVYAEGEGWDYFGAAYDAIRAEAAAIRSEATK